jgi:hypothetical protein
MDIRGNVASALTFSAAAATTLVLGSAEDVCLDRARGHLRGFRRRGRASRRRQPSRNRSRKAVTPNVKASTLAGEPIAAKLTHAPGNGAPIDGLRVICPQRLVCGSSNVNQSGIRWNPVLGWTQIGASDVNCVGFAGHVHTASGCHRMAGMLSCPARRSAGSLPPGQPRSL